MRVSQMLKPIQRKAATTVTSGGKKWRIFKGSETGQVDGVTGRPAKSNLYYFEPANYDGDVLWSNGFKSPQQAREVLDSGWDPDLGDMDI